MINSIEIKNLYGYMNKKILFKDINFLVGINGCGKTSILKILLSFFNRDIEYFKKLNFDEIKLLFKEKMYIIKKEGEEIFYYNDDRDNHLYHEIIEKRSIFEERINELEKKIISFEKKCLKNKENLNELDKEIKILEDKKIKLEKFLKNYNNNNVDKETLKKIENTILRMEIMDQVLKTREKVNVILQENSLFELETKKIEIEIESLIVKKEELTKKEKLLKNIKEVFFEFNTNYFSMGIDEKYDLKQFEAMVEKLINNEETSKLKEKMLYSLSPIEKVSKILNKKTDEYLREINKQNQNKDYNKISNKILDEINEFINIINLFFKESYKKLIFKEDEAKFVIEILNKEKQSICSLSTENLTILSSGEQQILILITTLFFTLTNNSILLIDEPEKSMHVEWQKNFMVALKKIIKKYENIQIILATHSIDMVEEENRDNFIPVLPYNITEAK